MSDGIAEGMAERGTAIFRVRNNKDSRAPVNHALHHRSARIIFADLRTDMSSPEFSIPAHELDASGKRFRFPVRLAWLRGALEATDVGVSRPDGQLDVRGSRSGTAVVVRGLLPPQTEAPCARSLEP